MTDHKCILLIKYLFSYHALTELNLLNITQKQELKETNETCYSNINIQNVEELILQGLSNSITLGLKINNNIKYIIPLFLSQDFFLLKKTIQV